MKVTMKLEDAFIDASYGKNQVTVSVFAGLEAVMKLVNAELQAARKEIERLDTRGNYIGAAVRHDAAEILRKLEQA